MPDVIIVGCGPVGAFAANLLAQTGMQILVLERDRAAQPLPRAVHVDHEMLRLFQSAGIIDEMIGQMRDTDGHLHVGADIGVIRYMGTVGCPRPFGWSNDYFFHQPDLEACLRAKLASYANVELRLGAQCVGIEQDANGVVATVSWEGRTEAVETRWLIGCDGARSAVRQHLGIALEDLHFNEPWLVVDAEVDGPIAFPAIAGVPEGANLQTLSVMMCNPRRPATVVPGPGNLRRWEFMLLPGEDDAEMMQPAKVAELLEPYLKGVSHRLLRAATYRFHGLVAERWQDGRVFLAGDAAHQTPPFFGQGMCHGFRDVANLAWKLDCVARGIGHPDLLDTYEVERAPHVRSIIAAAVEAGRYICMLDPHAAAERDAAMRARNPGTNATAADLIPAIRAGLIAANAPGAGERFIQPRVRCNDQTVGLLDDVTGPGWRLFANSTTAFVAARQMAARVEPLRVTVTDCATLDDDGAVSTWLASRAVDAALIRPDHYVFGAGNDGAALIEMLAADLRAQVAHLEQENA